MNSKTSKKKLIKIAINAAKFLVPIITVSAALSSLYIGYFYDKEPKIQYEIFNQSNVFDLKSDLSKLDIIYDSTSLKKQGKNLKIIDLRIKNIGNGDIEKSFFDTNYPLGLNIENGRIVELPQILNTSDDDYYLSRINPTIMDTSQIIFSDLILNIEDFFELKILVLHDQNIIPEIKSTGKVSGVKEITVITSDKIERDIPFWEKSFYGNIGIQIIRSIIYFLVVILLILTWILILDKYDNVSRNIKRKNRISKRQKIVKEFLSESGFVNKEIYDVVFRFYRKYGTSGLKHKAILLQDTNEINNINGQWTKIEKLFKGDLPRFRFFDKEDHRDLDILHDAKIRISEFDNIRLKYNKIELLKNEGYLTDSQGKLVANGMLKSLLVNFVQYLDQKDSDDGESESIPKDD